MNLYNRALYNEATPGPKDLSGPITPALIVNSTTYVDLLGILVGLERIPGETSTDFADRVARAGMLSRTPNYFGLMNELHLQFGFELTEAISINAGVLVDIYVDLAGVHVRGAIQADSPLMNTGPENCWEWRRLSDVVADLTNAGLTASLLVPDAPAFQLAYQSNVMLSVAEPISGQLVRLAHPGAVTGSETFNIPVPAYTYRADSVIEFSNVPPEGMRVSYQYKLWPYTLISSPVFLLSMLDPHLGTLAVAKDGTVAYQVREYVQEIMGKDRSYWAR